MEFFVRMLALILLTVTTASAQGALLRQTISTFIYTHYGDRTPFVLPQDPTLTPLGAQQLYQAGQTFASRYITPLANTQDTGYSTIRNISPYQLIPQEITVLATNEQYVVASAQAFLQGLYPPLSDSNASYIEGQSPLADGTNVLAPLDGYQYANVQAVTANDLNSIWTQGANQCPAYGAATNEYYNSPEYRALQSSTTGFYQDVGLEYLTGVFSDASVGYFDAYYIWDYLNFEMIHNVTVADSLDETTMARINVLAADWVYAMYGNLSMSGNNPGDHIGVIAGRTMAARILQAFYTTISRQGDTDKMTLLFGGLEPMVGFAALASLLDPQNSAFYNIPQPGSSFVFELFSLRENDLGTYPEFNELYVRFLYQNGTGDGSTAVEYPLFGRSPSLSMMSLSDFVAGLDRVMIYNVEDWCTTCSSFSIFCPAFTDTNDTSSSGSTQHHHKGLSSAVAGVIGAVVALVVFALILAAIMLLGGCRIHRVDKKRRSDLGGFKGAEKLASDQDLTLPKNRSTTEVTEPAVAYMRGHERVGSWELRDAKAEEARNETMGASLNARMRRPSYEDDELNVNPYGAGVKPHDQV